MNMKVFIVSIAAVLFNAYLIADAYKNPSATRVAIIQAETEQAKAVAKIAADAETARIAVVKEMLPAISACRLKMHEQLKPRTMDPSTERGFIDAACSSIK